MKVVLPRQPAGLRALQPAQAQSGTLGLKPLRAGPGHQLSALAAIAQRDVTKLARDRLRLAVSLAFPVMLMVGLGYVLQPTVGEATGLREITVAFTGVLAASLFQSASAGMISVVEDRENDFARAWNTARRPLDSVPGRDHHAMAPGVEEPAR